MAIRRSVIGGTNDGPSSSSSSLISHKLLIRLLMLITAMTIFTNLLFLVPLEEHYSERLSSSANNHQLSSHYTSSISSSSNNNNSSESIAAPKQENPFEISFPVLTEEEGKQHILDLFKEAKVEVTPQIEAELPKWSQVQEVVGSHPYLLGLEHCSKFRDEVPPLERMLGSAGMFNTGTNLVTHLLKQNCEIPERRAKMGPHQSKESYGMRWQVPWGKHTPAKFRTEHATEKAAASGIRKEYILPVVTIRNPYTWFNSMCKNGYTAQWDGRGKKSLEQMNCPKLKKKDGKWNPVTVKYNQRQDAHASLAHLWNDWYGYYINQQEFPYVVIRMEDLIFYPQETITAVCECAGGKIRKDQDAFTFITESAKADSPGHDTSTGMSAAWIKYSQKPKAKGGYTLEDYEAAKEALNQTLMDGLGYNHPPPK